MTKARRAKREADEPEPPRTEIEADGDVVGGDKMQAGRDIVGGDVVGGSKAGRDIVTVSGFSPAAVQRLIITVGVMVFATAACFFSGGIFIGATVFNSLERRPTDPAGNPTDSTLESALAMKAKIDDAKALPQGTEFGLPFSEVELSSYIRFVDQVEGTQFGLTDGKVRFIEPGVIAVGGRLAALANLPVAVTLEFSGQADTPLEVRGAAVQIIQIPNSSFGWIAIPTGLVQSFADQIASLLRGIRLTQIAVSDAQWTAFGVKQ